jgi:pyruvate dehydrogenase E2 component (dihydrolipoamide acetyltransferase)
LARELDVNLAAVFGSGPEGRVTEEDVRRHASAPAAPARAGAVEVRASPLARRLAAEHGLDLAAIQGTGPDGRIDKGDVERAIAAAPPGEVVPFTGMRRTIAQRMHESLQSMAQLTVTTQADVTEAVRLRERLVEEWHTEGIRPTYTDFVLRAVATTLPEHPRVNATLEGDNIRLFSEANVGLAVSLDEGLIVPVIHGADRLSLKEIARRSAELAEKARAGTLTVDEVSGGTFTVTSLGPYGVDTFTPVVNPPQAAILGVGRIKEVAGFEGDQVVRRQAVDLSLSFDHRLLDGAPAAEFLGRVRQLLEEPHLLVQD